MTTIKSDKAKISAPAEKVFEKVRVTADTISIPAGPVGEITLRITDRLPYSLIQLTGESTPVPMNLQLEIEPQGADACEVQVAFNLEIPVMLKPMVQGPLKKVADQFAQVMTQIPF